MKFAKKILSIFLRFGISILLLILIFRQVDEKSMMEIIRSADKGLLFIGFFIFFLSYVLCFFRWHMLLKAAQIHLSVKRILTSFAGGVFSNLFLPSTIGGDFVRTIDLGAETKKTRAVVATVFLDRLSGYIGMVALALLAISLGWSKIQEHSALIFIIFLALLLISILLVLFNNFFYSRINRFLDKPSSGKIREILRDVHDEIYIVRGHKKMILRNLLISFFAQVVSPLSFYFVALALGIHINIIYFFIFLPIVGAITLLPISIGGLGLRDASVIYFFAKVGVVKDMAFAMSLTSFSFVIACGALGGLVYVLTVHHRRVQSS